MLDLMNKRYLSPVSVDKGVLLQFPELSIAVIRQNNHRKYAVIKLFYYR